MKIVISNQLGLQRALYSDCISDSIVFGAIINNCDVINSIRNSNCSRHGVAKLDVLQSTDMLLRWSVRNEQRQTVVYMSGDVRGGRDAHYRKASIANSAPTNCLFDRNVFIAGVR